MIRPAFVACLFLAAASCGGDGQAGAGSDPTGAPVASATVDSTDKLTFDPRVVLLSKGGTVTWTNTGAVPHTVTFPGFDKPLKAGDRVEFTFDETGTTKVRCTLHPSMTGEIRVV